MANILNKYGTYCLLLTVLQASAGFAQARHNHAFGDKLLLGYHIGVFEDYKGSRDNQNQISDFSMGRAGVSLGKYLYAGLQTRFIRAKNFEEPPQYFYMAGLWVRGYLVHPIKRKHASRMGAFCESGFMRGNYAYDVRNSIEYAFEKPHSWYLPFILGAEYRVWAHFTLELAINTCYTGESWDQKGIAYLSIGANWHWCAAN